MKKEKTTPQIKKLDPETLKKILEESDFIVCAKAFAMMRKTVADQIWKDIRRTLIAYRSAIMLTTEQTPENEKLIVQGFRDEFSKLLKDIVPELRIDVFMDMETGDPMKLIK